MITNIRLQQFRSYQDASFEIGSGVNIIVGPNAAGKTNLLEAILVLARGSSYKAKDAELVQFNKDWARLDADLSQPDGRRTIKIETATKQSKSYELDGKIYQRLSLVHTIPAVLFEPNHLLLLHGSPDKRRDYLDDLLEQTMAAYGSYRRNYRRLLSQRNALLKRPARPSAEEMFPWNLRLAELAATISRYRDDMVKTINKDITQLYRQLSSTKTDVKISYSPNFPVATYESQILNKLETHAHIDAERGFTAYGPHREDFTVFFDGHPASETASRGETRTAVLALKIMELRLLDEARDQTPILLLDDVFSELDGRRRRALTEYLRNYQTFLTTTDADVVLKNFTDKTQIIPIMNG